MLHLAARMAARRLTALIAVACAVFGGAALVTGTGVLAESGVRSHLPTGRLAGADVVVSADQNVHLPGDIPLALPERGPVPAELVMRLGRLPGVTGAVGDVSFPAAVVTSHGRVVPTADPKAAGHGWSSTGLAEYLDVEGTPPREPGEVALDSGLARGAGVGPGDRVQVVASGRAGMYRVTAVVTGAGAGAGILFDDDTASRLAGTGRGHDSRVVSLVGLHTATGEAGSVAAAARELVSGDAMTVTTGAARGDVTSPDAAAAGSLLLLLAGSLAGITLLIVGFVVAGALAVSLTGQRRELALLRAVGATPRQIRQLAAGQATAIALVALVPGIGLGYLLADRFRGLLVEVGMLPDGLPLTVSPLPALVAVLLLALVVQVAARAITWRTSRLSATEAVAESRSEPRTPSRLRTRIGLLMIVAATTLSVSPLLARTQLGAATTSMAGILAALGLAVAGPGLVKRLSHLLATRLRSGASAPTWLAASNIHAYPLRMAGAVTTLAMAVVFTLTYVLSQTTVMSAVASDIRAGTLGEVSITAPALGGIPAGLLSEVRGTHGVRAAATVSTTTVLWRHRVLGDVEVESTPALIVGPAARAVLDLDVRSGSLRRLTGATVAVGTDLAGARGAGVGRAVDLVLGDGTRVKARVVATFARSLGFGPVVLSRDLASGHTTSGLDQSILARTDATPASRDSLRALVAAWPGLDLAATRGAPGGSERVAPPEVWINLATIVVLLGYLLLGIANSLVATTAHRRNEIATLRLIGATARQVRTMMRREATFVGATAVTWGLLISLIPLALLGIGFLSRPWPAGPGWLLPATILTVGAIAFLTVELPTRHVLRSSPVRTLGDF